MNIKYICDKCNKQFNRKWNAQRHKLTCGGVSINFKEIPYTVDLLDESHCTKFGLLPLYKIAKKIDDIFYLSNITLNKNRPEYGQTFSLDIWDKNHTFFRPSGNIQSILLYLNGFYDGLKRPISMKKKNRY